MEEAVQPEPKNLEQRFGLFASSGSAIFNSPNPAQLERLAENRRIEYFHYRIPGAVKQTMDLGDGSPIEVREEPRIPAPEEEIEMDEKEVEYVRSFFRGKGGLGGLLYEKYITNFLAQHIAEQMPGQTVGIRGIGASINGIVKSGDIVIDDIAEIVDRGAERGRDETLITTLTSDQPEIQYRTLQWLIQSPQKLRELLTASPDDSVKIFPCILVYDLSKLTPKSGSLYGAILPVSAEERAKAILKAYILDYPNK